MLYEIHLTIEIHNDIIVTCLTSREPMDKNLQTSG